MPAGPSPSWPAVNSQVACTLPLLSDSAERLSASQNRFFSEIRYLTLRPICGRNSSGSCGSNTMLSHTDGGTVRITSSAVKVRPSAHATSTRSAPIVTVLAGIVQQDALGADLSGELLRELLVAALAVKNLGLGPVLLHAAAFHGRKQSEIALPLRRHAGFGHEVGDDRLFGDLGRIDRHDLLGDGHQVERLGVRTVPWLVLEHRSGIVADRPKDVVKSIPERFRFAVRSTACRR